MSGIWWPRSLLAPRKVTVELAAMTGGGLAEPTPDEFTQANFDGYWKIVFDEVPLASPTQKRAWRAISAWLDGRANPIAVPIYDHDNAPWPLDGTRKPKDPPFADSQLFSNDLELNGNVIEAWAAATAMAGSNTLLIQMGFGSPPGEGVPLAGLHFSVKDRLYRINRATLGSPFLYTCEIVPMIRETIFANDALNFDDPRVLVKLATDAEMHSGIDDYAARGLAKVAFEEDTTDIPPWPLPPPPFTPPISPHGDPALFFYDFVNGNYWDSVANALVPAATIIDTPSMIVPGTGLVYSTTPPPQLLSNALAYLLLQSWTVILDIDTTGDTGGFVQWFTVADSGDNNEVGTWQNNPRVNPASADWFGTPAGTPDRTFNVSGASGSLPAAFKLALTCNGTSNISGAIQGGAASTVTGHTALLSVTLAMLFDYPGDSFAATMDTIKSITIYPVQPDTDLPALTT